jgi:hypothetical protein
MRPRRTPLAALVVAALILILAVAGGATAVALKGRSAMPDTHDEGWQWLHGRAYVADRVGCESCHDEIDCKTCHLADYPHDDGWLESHGPEAIQLRGRGCSLCHRSGFCDPCHGGVVMPHPDTFYSEHTSLADDAACLLCHLPSDCAPCHRQHGAHRAGGMVFP